MIAKSCDVKDRDWDDHLPYLLFAYRVSAQGSTRESPFFLLYGRDARIPTSTVLSYARSPYAVDIDDFKADMLSELSQAWTLAASNMANAQASQRKHYDRNTRSPDLRVGDRVMVHMPAEVQGKDWKLSRPFHGPYRVLSVTPTNVEVRLVDCPTDDAIFVAMNRVHRCYPEQGDTTWTGPPRRRRRKRQQTKQLPPTSDVPYQGPNTRSRIEKLEQLSVFCESCNCMWTGVIVCV